MGTNSACPDDLDAFSTGSREADVELERAHGALQAALDEFAENTDWVSFDAGGLMHALGSYTRANGTDALWTAQIASRFRSAGSGGTMSLPDSALEASLRAADLDHDRVPLDVVDPVVFGAQETSGYADDPVNTAVGNFVEVESELLFTGLLAKLTLERTYNSRSDRDGPFGPRWSCWATTRLVAGPDGAEYEGPDGQRTTFPRMGAGFGRVVGVKALVERVGAELALAWFGGERWIFDAAGRLTSVAHGPGTEVRLDHDGEGRLVAMRHVRGREVALQWDGARIVGLSSSDGREAAYRYDEHGNLVEAEGVAGVRRYALDDAGLIASVTDADGVVELVNTYDEHGRVLTQLSPFGRRTIFSYLPGNVTVTSDDSGGPTNTFVHDRAGRLIAVVDGHEQTLRKNYDDWGNPVAIVERNGAVTVQEWDDRARLVRRTRPSGVSFDYLHDEADRLVTVTASTGATTHYRYDDAERTPAEIVDPEGGVTRLTVSDGLILDVTDPDGVVTRLRYDDGGHLVAAVDADGATAVIERDAAGNAVAAVTPGGRRTVFRYDHRGLLTERTGPDGGTWRYEYSAVGRPAAVVDPLGARIEVRYGAHGEVAEVVDPLGGITGRRYDPFGNLTGLTAPDGAKWEYVYDALSRLTALTDPAGATWLREYDVEGNLVGSTDPMGVRYSATVDLAGRVTGLDDGLTSSTFEFDELGRTTAHVRPDGTALRATYDGCGRRITETAPDGGVSRYEYSPAGRVRRVVTAAGRIETCAYDRCGRLSSRVDGVGGTWTLRYDVDGTLTERVTPTGERESFERDGAGRIVRHTTPGSGTTTYVYDAVGRVIAVTDRLAGTRRFGYDAAGRLVSATDAHGGVTRYGYNARGWLVRVTDPLGGLTTRSYDEVGRLVAETDPLQRTTTFGYDPAGRLIERADPTGSRLRWAYDVSGRVRSVRGGGDDAVVSVERDVLGRPTVVSEPGRRPQELRWDRAGRLVERRSGELAMRWAYDADGYRSELGYPDGSRAEYVRDGGGRTVALDHPLLGRVRMERDAAGRLVGLHGDGLDTTWRYDDGELVAHEVRRGAVRRSTRLTRDADGRTVAVDVDGRTRRFGYDAAGQLVAASGPDGERLFAYDAGGRLVSETGVRERSYTYDAAGQLLTAGENRYAYDAAGRRVGEAGPEGESTYGWDWMGRLAQVTTTGSDGWDRSVDLVVDALGELEEVDGTRLMWDTADPASPLAWIGQSAVVGDGHPLAVVDAASAAAGRDPWLASDWQDSVTATDDPWGSASADLQLGYRGELAVEGLVWLRNRAYDPGTRAFLTPDPLPPVPGTPYAANPYHYAGNDPVNQVDPLGLRPKSDAEMQALRDQKGKGAWGSVTHWWKDNASAAGHMVFDVAGLVPVVGEVFDGLNAVWYLAEGDNVNAGLSAAGMIPLAGWGATATKFGMKGYKATKTGEKVASEAAEELGDSTARKAADDVFDNGGARDDLLLGGEADAHGGKLGAPTRAGGGSSAADAARLAEDLRTSEAANPIIQSLNATGRLPDNFVTKSEAMSRGWEPGKALDNYVPGGQMGGDIFRDPGKIGLPTAPGRVWYEADVGLTGSMSRAKQPGTRLLYSNDGLAYVTPDHYERIYQLPDWSAR